MNTKDLTNLQRTLYNKLGFKVDVYHDEKRRGVLVVPHNESLIPANVLHVIKY